MAAQNGAVVRRLQLGRALRELREAAGMTIEAAAPRLDWSSSKLSRIENGLQSIDVHGVRSMLDLYDAGGDRWTELIDLTRETRQKGWWRAFGINDKGYVPLEAAATLVRDVNLGNVPGLLQTAAYARAIFATSLEPRTEAELDRAVAIRTFRQRRLTSEEDPLGLVVLIDEAALRRPVGGPVVMREQYAHLLSAAALDRVTLHVLPTSLGARPALSAGFTLLTFADVGMPDMAYVEHPMGAIQMDKDAEVARATLVFDRLRSLALSPEDSVALIRRVADEM